MGIDSIPSNNTREKKVLNPALDFLRSYFNLNDSFKTEESMVSYLKSRTDQELLSMVKTLIDNNSNLETKKFTKWRTFSIGGISKEILLKKLESSSSNTKWAKDMIMQPGFITNETVEEIDTIILSPTDFGLENMPTTSELFDTIRLHEWSKQNTTRLPKDTVVELLPVEAGPHIHEQYNDQLKGEVLWVATEPMIDSRGGTGVFSVYWGVFGVQWLSGVFVRPNEQWSRDSRIIFRLRKIA